jgi:hypothetical protein
MLTQLKQGKRKRFIGCWWGRGRILSEEREIIGY